MSKPFTMNGIQRWHQDGHLHREDGPAWVDTHGNQKWYKNGYYHRIDGPALIFTDGTVRYWVENKQLNIEVMKMLTKNLLPPEAIACYLLHPGLTPDNIEEKTGWNPIVKPAQHQLNTWQTLVGLTR